MGHYYVYCGIRANTGHSYVLSNIDYIEDLC